MKENIIRIFIGSSTEGKEYAEALQILINENYESTIWNQGIFQPGVTSIESLCTKLDNFDLAVFIFTPDDKVISRGEKKNGVRDNLIFELGLAMGKLGYGKAIFVIPKNVDVKIPTDLNGITWLEFNSQRQDSNLIAAMGEVATRIKEVIKNIENKNLKINQKTEYTLEDMSLSIEDSIDNIISFSSHWEHHKAIIFLDIDQMRTVKEIYGDVIADEVTKEVGNIIQNLCREYLRIYHFAHIYTDSFAVILREDQINNLPNDIINAINIYDWGKLCIGLFLHISIGVAIKEENESYENWIKRAIHSCRMAKMEGGNRVGEIIKTVPPIYRRIHLVDQFSP